MKNTTAKNIELTDERRLDMLTGAFGQGGSGYWAELTENSHRVIDSVAKSDGKMTLEDRVWKTIKAGKEIPIYSKEEGKYVGFLSLKSIKLGEALMQEKQVGRFCEIITEEDDAETADVWFQFAVVNELRYG